MTASDKPGTQDQKKAEVRAKFWWDTTSHLRVVFGAGAFLAGTLCAVTFLRSVSSGGSLWIPILLGIITLLLVIGERVSYYFYLKIGEEQGYTTHFW